MVYTALLTCTYLAVYCISKLIGKRPARKKTTFEPVLPALAVGKIPVSVTKPFEVNS